MVHHLLAEVLRILQVAAFVTVLRFPIVYMRRIPAWRRSPEGRYLVFSKLSFSLILGLGMVAALWPGWATWVGRDYVRVGAYALLLMVFIWLNVLLNDAMRRAERYRKRVLRDNLEDK
jgi:hypothetical protein